MVLGDSTCLLQLMFLEVIGRNIHNVPQKFFLVPVNMNYKPVVCLSSSMYYKTKAVKWITAMQSSNRLYRRYYEILAF